MSKIVKSIAVVDDRETPKSSPIEKLEVQLMGMKIIKNRALNYAKNPYEDPTLVLPDKQGYIDELNRIKVEIAQAKAELRSLGRLFEDEEDEDEEIEQIPETDGDDDGQPEIDAGAEAERLIKNAKENINVMMQDAQNEAHRLAEEAKNAGYLEGFEQGFAQAQTEFKSEHEPKVKELEDLLEVLSAYKEDMVAQNEKDLISLVMTVSQKIVGREIKSDPRALSAMLYQVLDQNRREENIRITVSPELMPAEAKVSAEIRKTIMQTAPSALIYVDADAEEGTCYVETDKGITDLSVDTQLKNMQNMLTEE